ncbi:hypothetical protein AGMMS50218_04720 [Actinomycetota bacterium]|nr:hypothetical protein AGMMS50218_04720 [Actinomycetota bacterium]
MALVVTLIAGGLFFLAYKLGLYQPPRENAVDRDRLNQVLTDPLLTNPHVERVTTWRTFGPDVTRRATIVSSGPWQSVAEKGHEHTLAERSLQTLTDLRADGWQIVAASCVPSQSSFLAVKEFDGFTAALDGVVRSGSRLEVYVPYHGEPANPWTPTTVFPAGTTCIDQGDPTLRVDLPEDLARDDSARLAAEARHRSNITVNHDALAPPTAAPAPAPTYTPPIP